MNSEVTLQQGFPDDLRQAAAELYDAAFGAKLSIAIPDAAKRLAVLQQGIVPECSFVALKDGHLAGIAGFKTADGSFTGNITFHVLKDTLGVFGTLRAVLMFVLFERKCVPGQLLMDGIAVASHMRGGGIGTRLLRRLIDYARHEGYRSLRLDVIDTNPAARRLYERVGFIPVRTDYFPYLKWLLGFEASTRMEYKLNRES